MQSYWYSNPWIAITAYILSSIPVFVIAHKSQHPLSWLAFVPLASLWLMCDMGDKPIWWLLLFFIPYVNILVYALLWMAIAENTNKPSWLGILMLIPLVNLAVAYYMAFYEPENMRF